MPYEQLLQEAHANVSKLQDKLQSLDNVYSEIKQMKDNAGAIPGVFQSKYDEVIELSKGYLGNVKELETEYLKHLKALSADYLKSYDKQLTTYGEEFTGKIKLLQEKSDAFEKKLSTLEGHNTSLDKEIQRIEKVDLERRFNELQRTLGDIFTTLNTINNSISGVREHITINTNELKSSFDTQMTTLKSEIKYNKSEIITLRNQMNKSTKITWIINVIGFLIVIILAIMLLLK